MVHGASKCFAGGCVCYSNESRTQLLDIPEEIMMQHGAVSAETAVAMATGVLQACSGGGQATQAPPAS